MRAYVTLAATFLYWTWTINNYILGQTQMDKFTLFILVYVSMLLEPFLCKFFTSFDCS